MFRIFSTVLSLSLKPLGTVLFWHYLPIINKSDLLRNSRDNEKKMWCEIFSLHLGTRVIFLKLSPLLQNIFVAFESLEIILPPPYKGLRKRGQEKLFFFTVELFWPGYIQHIHIIDTQVCFYFINRGRERGLLSDE